ncbi:MAG TPA: hypothetical protein VJL34_00445, partial [Anaerolineales bacterium]|nr:hypothetical protein [Anaerolineales bacterium]
HHYAIIDEVDNVLIDEARTPLIISGPAQDEAEWYVRMAQVVKQLRLEDYEVSEKDRTVTLTEIGEAHVEDLLGMALRDPDRPEDVTPEQARMLGYLEQALRAQHLFQRNKEYLVQAGKVVIVDEFTGRLMPGRRWSDGLHQAVEAKEGARVQPENVTYATITIQNYFRMYEKLAGMSGTALTEAEEFDKIYSLGVLAIPTNLEYQASRPDSDLEQVEDRDQAGYKYTYYAHRSDPNKVQVFWKRKDYPDVVYRTEEAKLRAICQEILQYHSLGRPILVGTTSVELSERLSARLRAEPLRRLAQVLLLRQTWFEKNDRVEDGRQVPELQFLNAQLDQLDIGAMRKLSRELGISFNPEEAENVDRLLFVLALQSASRERLVAALKGGISHQVLNARKHTEESQIIARGGEFGAVTIATNMAGRGVDIKLGGEFYERTLAIINRVLMRAGFHEAYDMTMEERLQALEKMNPDQYGIYGEQVSAFFNYMKRMKLVKELGGLHVIGSVRHEARRIDNQLRGRAARQGDPGSSRFYLSMEDDLMRLFGGQQADALMQRMKIDDAMPLEVGLVSRIVEQSQTRVEGANFDVRKHLLEYDDVLNDQRAKIYAQRNIIFAKDDLSEDVTEMLRLEVSRRVPEALEDAEGPWKLIAWLDQVQPPLPHNGVIFPSYSLKLLVEHLTANAQTLDAQTVLERLLEIARQALIAEENHLLKTVDLLLNQAQDRMELQLAERNESVDTFLEGLELADETDTRSSRQVVDELTSAVRLPIKLSAHQQRLLLEDPDDVADEIYAQVENQLIAQAVTRLIGSIERRLDEGLDLDSSALSLGDFNQLADLVLMAIQSIYQRRRERYLGDGAGSQIAKDLEAGLGRLGSSLNANLLYQLLIMMPQGARAAFDKKTHRRVFLRTTRFTYNFYVAQLLEGRDPQEISEDVLSHLEKAQEFLKMSWGAHEWNRIASAAFNELDQTTQRGLRNVLEGELFQQHDNQPLKSLAGEHRQVVVSELGRQALTEIYRQLLLQVITELWVDYLTQMEALRISIGLEAYAQRDPLVQYKSRAYALFQELLANIRLSIVSKMFTFRPRDLSSVQTTVSRVEAPEIEAGEPEMVTETQSQPEKYDSPAKGKKRRRKRR